MLRLFQVIFMDVHEAPVSTFQVENGFCWCCGNILTVLGESGPVKCFICQSEYLPEVYGDMCLRYEICFHSRLDYKKSEEDSLRTSADKDTAVAGPTVERKCVKCGSETMSYATLQLRSADEGQTVFYTCSRCGYKESENS